MKALVTADLHLDKNRRFEDSKDILRQMVAYVKANRIDQVWILGDIYDRKRPFNVEKVLFHKFIKTLSDMQKLVLILPGNHDSGADNVSAVEEFGVLDLPNVKLINNPAIIDTENGKIYLGHFLVNGAKLGASDFVATNAISLQGVLSTPAELYLLGDVHKAQQLNTNPDVAYVGAPDRIDFGERGEDKGFVLVETSPADIRPRWTFVPLNVRHMVQYDVDNIPEKGITTNSDKDAIVKFKITCTKEEYKNIDEAEIRKEFEEAYSLKIEYNIIKEDRARQSNISEGCSYEEAFINYAKVAEFDEEITKLGLDIINDN